MRSPLQPEDIVSVPSVSELIAQLTAAVESLEVRYRVGEVTPGDVQAMKSTVDDARLRLWSLLNTGTGEDGKAFEERYRLRRAREICGRISQEIRAGSLARHPELSELSAASAELATAIDAVKG